MLASATSKGTRGFCGAGCALMATEQTSARKIERSRDVRMTPMYTCRIAPATSRALLLLRERLAHGGRDARAEQFDGLHELCGGGRRRIHLEREAGDPAQPPPMSDVLLPDPSGTPDPTRTETAHLAAEARPG